MKVQMLFIFAVTLVDCARILVINPTPSYSHQIVIRPIVIELSKRGHDVVFATTHPIRNSRLTNLKEIDLGLDKSFTDTVSSARPSFFNLVLDLIELHVNESDAQLNHPEMQHLLRNENERFDLVMAEYVAPTMFAFKVRFNCPFIAFMSLNAQNSDHKNFGNFDNPALYPDSYVSDGKVETFLQRVFNVIVSVIFELHREYTVYPRATEIIRAHFGEGYPDAGRIAADADMLFVASNLILGVVRPITPAVIMIGGGIHMEGAKELPKNIKTFLDNSKRGTIYVSFGSNVQSSKLPPRVIQMFLKTFSELPYDFLWKFEDESLPTKSKNVLVSDWIPQQDVLRHENVKLFITQAGLQSSEEALIHGIPMLAIPFFADQHYISNRIVNWNVGLMVEDLNTLTCKKLKFMVTELLQNSTYLKNVKNVARIIKDEPMKPIEKAIWWTEYVLRHKGAKHLQGPIVPFYQRYLFDVLAFFILSLVLVAFCFYKLSRFVFGIFQAKNKVD